LGKVHPEFFVADVDEVLVDVLGTDRGHHELGAAHGDHGVEVEGPEVPSFSVGLGPLLGRVREGEERRGGGRGGRREEGGGRREEGGGRREEGGGKRVGRGGRR
jgi:hypothetical protein